MRVPRVGPASGGGSGGGSGSVSASNVSVTATGNITEDNVQAALGELDALIPDPNTYNSSTGGGGEGVASQTTSGAVTIDLSDGNVQTVILDGDATSVTVTGASEVNDGISFFLEIQKSTHAWVWFDNITWDGIGDGTVAPSLPNGTHRFSCISKDGGVNWIVYWLSATEGYKETAPFSVSGNISTTTGAKTYYNDSGKTRTLRSIRASVGTAPTTQPILIDVNINGATIWSTQANRLTITGPAKTHKQTTFDTSTWADGSYLTIDVDQVGSGTTGADLVVQIFFQEG